jgi:spore coat polysaccharide biosynthesis protein SpsF
MDPGSGMSDHIDFLRPEPADHLRIVAVIQARMGSTRLPGKVLKPVAGKPLLWHIVHRLKRSQFIERIAIATSTNPRDDAIVSWAKENGVPVVRGPEDDVLARFARAAELLDADIVVRVSSDAPFVDAGFVDHLVAALIEQNGDYVLMQEGAACGHEGVDPFSRRALDRLMMDAANDPVAREHVTGYFKLHPDFVRIARARPYAPLARNCGRLTVDTPDDLAFVEAVHARMDAKAGEASLADLLLLLEREPELRKMNAHVRQKPLAPEGGLALIRCDGGGRFGYGHVKRTIALARALRDREGLGALFALNGTEAALRPIRDAGFEAVRIDAAEDAAALERLARQRRPDLLICDMREGLSRADLAGLRDKIGLAAVVDDGSKRRLAADLAYYPPVPQAAALDWRGSSTLVRVGWEWAVLGTAPQAAAPNTTKAGPCILVSMGGSDPMNLTRLAAQALAGGDFHVQFVIGPGVRNASELARGIEALSPRFETREGVSDLSVLFGGSDVALCAFGVTAYELAAAGVPTLYLCPTEDHAASASAFEQAGMGQSLGLAANATPKIIAGAVAALLADAERRRDMRAAGLMSVDGGGAARIAADLKAALTANRAGLRKVAP